MSNVISQPVLLLTHDDVLWQRWQSLDPKRWSVERGTSIGDLTRWQSQGRRLVLLDADLPGLPGWRDPIWFRTLGDLRVVLASATPRDDAGATALAAGMAGYCHAYADAESLGRILEVVDAGEIWLGRSLVSRLLRVASDRLSDNGDWAASLTERERAVAKLAAQGDSNQAIAEALDITERTVKAHLSAVFEKIGVSDRLQLALRVHGIH